LENTNKEFGAEVNVRETKYRSMSHHQNAGQKFYIETANKLFENVVKFKYLGGIVTNEDYIHQEIKKQLTPWSRVLLESKQYAQLVKFPTFYGT
jgi:ribosomal protein S2